MMKPSNKLGPLLVLNIREPWAEYSMQAHAQAAHTLFSKSTAAGNFFSQLNLFAE